MLWLRLHVVARVLRERRVDRAGLDERQRDRSTFLLDLHPQGIGERLHRVLAGRVVALKRDGTVTRDAAEVDDGATMVLEMRDCRERAVDDAPVVHVEEPPRILD